MHACQSSQTCSLRLQSGRPAAATRRCPRRTAGGPLCALSSHRLCNLTKLPVPLAFPALHAVGRRAHAGGRQSQRLPQSEGRTQFGPVPAPAGGRAQLHARHMRPSAAGRLLARRGAAPRPGRDAAGVGPRGALAPDQPRRPQQPHGQPHAQRVRHEQLRASGRMWRLNAAQKNPKWDRRRQGARAREAVHAPAARAGGECSGTGALGPGRGRGAGFSMLEPHTRAWLGGPTEAKPLAGTSAPLHCSTYPPHSCPTSTTTATRGSVSR